LNVNKGLSREVVVVFALRYFTAISINTGYINLK